MGSTARPNHRGLNCRITTQQSGSYSLRAIGIYHGVNIIADEGQAQVRHVFYPTVTTTSGFGLDVAFNSYKERNAFSTWLQAYMDNVVAGRGFKAPVWVDVPSRAFSRQCIPEGSTRGDNLFGEGITDISYVLNLSFTGASDAIEISSANAAAHSQFTLPTKDVKHAKNYYPGGIQLSGAGALDESMYDGWEHVAISAHANDEYDTDPIDPASVG